jgi:predicted dienelactone hydrolase
VVDPTAAEILRIRRLAIGASSDTTTLPDADLIALWNEDEGAGDVVLTAAAACDFIAAQLSLKIPQWSADGQSINRSTQPALFRTRAMELRRGYFGSGTITLTRSEDVDDALDTEYAP